MNSKYLIFCESCKSEQLTVVIETNESKVKIICIKCSKKHEGWRNLRNLSEVQSS